jgi:hypothetical protein
MFKNFLINRIVIYAISTLVSIMIPNLAMANDVPSWLQQAISSNAPTYKKDVPGVVLLNEQVVNIEDNGHVTTSTTYVIRILTMDGRGLAEATEFYDTDTGKVRELRAWLIKPNGKVKKYGKDETLDGVADLSDVYNESRMKSISAKDDAEIGAVFAYQSISEDKAMFPQTVWTFQDRLPTLVSRYTLNLPTNWTASSITFNSEKIEPIVKGTSYVWERRNLPPIEPEPSSPNIAALAPRIAINYAPPASSSKNVPGGRIFAKWEDVSRWYTDLSDPQAIPDNQITNKAKELTANSKTEIERIQAIGRYVQSLQYISIQIGIGRFQPHAASHVFSKMYGDCKDKANLMRAMLKAINITSYPVLIYSGDRTFVREDWASPGQFNHCIIAVKISDETKAMSVVTHPTLGRLLIFDATDSDTPVGDLPYHEQGSLALIAAGDNGQLMRMPVAPPEENTWERKIKMDLNPNGSISVVINDNAIGQPAAKTRRLFNNRSKPEFIKSIESWITVAGVTGAKITKAEPSDNYTSGQFAINIEFSVDRYAQSLRNSLLVLKPSVIARRGESLFLKENSRSHPIVIEAEAFNETIEIKVPDGFQVDEVPDPVKLDTPFGSYITKYEVKGNQLVVTRKLVQLASVIPANQYADVRTFMNNIQASETAPVVLVKK